MIFPLVSCDGMCYDAPMDVMIKIFLSVLLSVSAVSALQSQEKQESNNSDLLLSDIAANVANYKSKDLTLRLRLKYVDRIFEKIIFYDRKNNDIEFDISGRDTRKRLERDMRSLHEGMQYLVTMTVLKAGDAGEITAELVGFRPVFLDNIPLRGNGQP